MSSILSLLFISFRKIERAFDHHLHCVSILILLNRVVHSWYFWWSMLWDVEPLANSCESKLIFSMVPWWRWSYVVSGRMAMEVSSYELLKLKPLSLRCYFWCLFLSYYCFQCLSWWWWCYLSFWHGPLFELDAFLSIVTIGPLSKFNTSLSFSSTIVAKVLSPLSPLALNYCQSSIYSKLLVFSFLWIFIGSFSKLNTSLWTATSHFSTPFSLFSSLLKLFYLLLIPMINLIILFYLF